MSDCYVPPLRLALGDTLVDSLGLGVITPPATVAVPKAVASAVYEIWGLNGVLVYSCATTDETPYITIGEATATYTPLLVSIPPSVTSTFPITGPLPVPAKRAFKVTDTSGVVKTSGVRDIILYPAPG